MALGKYNTNVIIRYGTSYFVPLWFSAHEIIEAVAL